MSAHVKLTEAVEALLGAHAGLGIVVNGVFDAPPQRAVRPYAVIEDAVLVDWSTKDMIGREGRLAVALFEAGEDRTRLRALADQIAAAIAGTATRAGRGLADRQPRLRAQPDAPRRAGAVGGGGRVPGADAAGELRTSSPGTGRGNRRRWRGRGASESCGRAAAPPPRPAGAVSPPR